MFRILTVAGTTLFAKMPASAADPVSSVLKNTFASNVMARNETGLMIQTTGLIRGGSSSSVVSNNGSFDQESVSFDQNASTKTQNNSMSSGNSSIRNSPNLENGIRANAKKALLSSQQGIVEFDAPTRYVGGIGYGQATSSAANANSNGKPRVIILNPNQKQLQVTNFVNNYFGINRVKNLKPITHIHYSRNFNFRSMVVATQQ